ncbi:MAG: polyhydroxyalkanoate depolymerase [Parvibaculaceae bacterium]|nr:polyhydroxyalkanoate depolymerase [Parvibaculaceae bacterium]
MLYQAFQARSDLMFPIRALAKVGARVLNWPVAGMPDNLWVRSMAAACEVIAGAKLTHARPPFGITSVKVGNRLATVTEEAAWSTPFGTLLHFKKDIETPQPRVLIVAPLSGHFATLLRNTVEVMLQDHDVYITDWHNARDISVRHGQFGFDDYVDHLIKFLEVIGPGGHILAVCQPCVQALVAVSVMAEDKNPAQPRTMTLMAGPIDCRISPTEVNRLAMDHPIEWFKEKLIATVPLRYRGAGRKVYPGFMQLTAFMSMNPQRHINAQVGLYGDLTLGEAEKAEATKTFYEEYFAVLDLTAEFYLETVQWVFQEYRLPKGELKFRGRTVNPANITRTALLTVEGERDDICSVGQTLAAHELCKKIRPYMKKHHLQAGVGHYGVFSGRRWAGQIYPIVRNMILSRD